MRKLCLLLLSSLLSFLLLQAQNVGINDDNTGPHSSAMLHVQSSTKGLLIPRMTALQRTAIAAPANGLLVYQTDGLAGYYYYQETPQPQWLLLAAASNVWSLNGNAGTTADNFIGTINDEPLIFKVQNTHAGKIKQGFLSTSYGYAAGSKITVAGNTAIGYKALRDNETGESNTAVGTSALLKSTAGFNTAIGDGALLNNTTGANNTAVGYNTLASITVGAKNTVIGANADVLGNRQNATAIGANTLANCDDCIVLGSINTINGAINHARVGIGTNNPDQSAVLELVSNGGGFLTPRMPKQFRDFIPDPPTGLLIYQTDESPGFYYNSGTSINKVWTPLLGGGSGWSLSGNAGTTASSFIGTTDAQPLLFKVNNLSAGQIQASNFNTSFGIGTLINTQVNGSLGNLNTAFGHSALYSNTTGNYNTAIGMEALYSNTVGQSNTAVGASALYTNTEGKNNTAVGDVALWENTIGIDNTAIGAAALQFNTSGSGNTASGYYALRHNTTGFNNTAFGALAQRSNQTGFFNTAIGSNSLYTNSTGSLNTAVGYHALYFNVGGLRNTAIGTFSLDKNTSGNDNVAVGNNALLNNTTGTLNTAVGNSALEKNISGYGNTAIGMEAMFKNTTGYQNVANGGGALYSNTTGSSNISVGVNSLSNNTTGAQNTAVGDLALEKTTQSWGNTAVGFLAGASFDNGYYNTFIGSETRATTAGIFNSTALGNSVRVDQANLMRFGNEFVEKWGFGVTPGAGRALQVGTPAGTPAPFNAANGNGAYLTTGGVWTNGSSVSFKEDFSSLDKKDILQKIAALNITRWRYKGSGNEYHIGPVAEEFYELFKVGTDQKYLSTIDPSGVALAGIQELARENEELKQLVNQLVKEMQQLKEKVEKGK
ncbi:MAG TPA: tail fiber domain-containing protein [Chitinophagaceae bacterium]